MSKPDDHTPLLAETKVDHHGAATTTTTTALRVSARKWRAGGFLDEEEREMREMRVASGWTNVSFWSQAHAGQLLEYDEALEHVSLECERRLMPNALLCLHPPPISFETILLSP